MKVVVFSCLASRVLRGTCFDLMQSSASKVMIASFSVISLFCDSGKCLTVERSAVIMYCFSKMSCPVIWGQRI